MGQLNLQKFESYPGVTGWVNEPDDMAIADVGRLRMHMAILHAWLMTSWKTSPKWLERGRRVRGHKVRGMTVAHGFCRSDDLEEDGLGQWKRQCMRSLRRSWNIGFSSFLAHC